jgi:signal transduction histidine kinase
LRVPAFIAANKRLSTAILLAASAGLLFGVTILLRPLSPYGSSPRTLDRLRNSAERIKDEFNSVLRTEEKRLADLTVEPLPRTAEERFARLRGLGLDPETEGAAITDADGKPTFWIGHALDIGDLIAAGAGKDEGAQSPALRLVRSKASASLVLIQRARGGEFVAVFRLLSFAPLLKSRYLEEYQFLPTRLRADGKIEYLDYRDEVSGYEKLFGRSRDEYVGQPGLQGRVQSLFFPLRDPHGRILATVNIRSRSPAALLQTRIDLLLFIAYGLLLGALLLGAMETIARTGFRSRPRVPGTAALLVQIAAFRAVLLPISRLNMVERISVFSPAPAGFRSYLGLTRSPADIWATAAALFLGLTAIAFLLFKSDSGRSAATKSRLVFAAALGVCVCAYPVFQAVAERLIRNTNINLLEFPLRFDFFLLQTSLGLVWAGTIALQAAVLRPVLRKVSHRLPFLGILAVLGLAVAGLFPPSSLTLHALRIAPPIALGFALSVTRRNLRQTAGVLAALTQVLFFYAVLSAATAEKSRGLAERFLKDDVLSLEPWARFLLEESFPELDREAKSITGFLQAREGTSNLARELWNKTLLAKFNWYSSLEVLTPDGEILSRFSLNIPKIFRPAATPVSRPDWTVAPITVPFMGRERRLLAGVREFSVDGVAVGRVLVYLSLDPDMLPFLYSANPYFELLRVNAIPSLRGFDIRFAVFDRGGAILFNPFKLSTGLPAAALAAGERWSLLTDKGRHFDAFTFAVEDRVFAVLLPRRSWRSHIVNIIKTAALFFLTSGLPLLIAAGISARRRGRRFLWSFADRVYLSFLVVALIPMFLFTVFSRTFFDRFFSQQFVEKAEIHADMARSVMDDFIFLQPEERARLEAPPEDLVLWISNTISNDVNLYQDGRLVASSRREFFDAGLLPELLDGEVFYRLRYENNPYIAKERRIGTFSLRTLTVPYAAAGARLDIALPFPFERRDIANAAAEWIEFLIFFAVFFIAMVLILARGIGSMIVTPIHRLLAGTREAGLGNLEFSISYDRRDEMKTLVDGFNAMIAGLKQHQRELAELGRKAASAEMARKVAHEIKNPLTPIQLSAEHILRVYEDGRTDLGPALRESISYIVKEVENLRRIAQEFLEISREPLLRHDIVSLDNLVRETVEPYRKLLAERIAIGERYAGEGFAVRGDREKLKIALRNLLTNAIESIRGCGEIRTRVESGPGGILIVIEDTGEGMAPDVKGRVFEPYFSTKGAGTGLGLPIAKKIVEDHGGSIDIESEAGRGTSVRIHLPHAPL